MCGREHHDGVSAKWEALVRCRRHRAAVHQMRGELQVHETPSLCNCLEKLTSSCILQKSLHFEVVWHNMLTVSANCRSACSMSGTTAIALLLMVL